jgi:hypothetical protein
MHEFWVNLWTAVWFVGLSVFSILSALVIIFGGRDVTALLGALRARHLAQQAAEAQGEPPMRPSPMQ